MKIKSEFNQCGWRGGAGKAFQAEGVASAKRPRQSILSILEEVKGGQCAWSVGNE